MKELIVDLFAGGGGASLGIELALGRSPDIAINHDREAIAMHEANHPRTVHLCGDVWGYSPYALATGPIGLLWASPDCKHFSKAKGAAVTRSKKIRSLAWVVVRWAKAVRPRVIILENVEEFQTWGPLTDGLPDPAQRGVTFRRWVSELRAEGYAVEWRELRACDYGAPTTRKRLFVIARCDGQPIVWPIPTHGSPPELPYRTAAECIDFTLPCPSIFGRSKPLAANTLRRIARGVKRFVAGDAPPFIVGAAAHALVQTGYGERPGQAPRVLDLGAPMGTVVAGGAKQALVAAFLAKHYGGNETPGSSLERPFDTITCKDHHALVDVYAESSAPADNRVREFADRFDIGAPVVTVNKQPYAIVDIGMRMLTPRELFRGQGFSDDYEIAPRVGGKVLTATAQNRMCGNSVSPPMARALVEANCGEEMRVAA